MCDWRISLCQDLWSHWKIKNCSKCKTSTYFFTSSIFLHSLPSDVNDIHVYFFLLLTFTIFLYSLHICDLSRSICYENNLFRCPLVLISCTKMNFCAPLLHCDLINTCGWHEHHLRVELIHTDAHSWRCVEDYRKPRQ